MKKITLFLFAVAVYCTGFSQNVGIGTTNPISKLTISAPDNTDGLSHISAGGIVLTERVGGDSASIGTTSNHAFRLLANGNPIINLDVFRQCGDRPD